MARKKLNKGDPNSREVHRVILNLEDWVVGEIRRVCGGAGGGGRGCSKGAGVSGWIRDRIHDALGIPRSMIGRSRDDWIVDVTHVDASRWDKKSQVILVLYRDKGFTCAEIARWMNQQKIPCKVRVDTPNRKKMARWTKQMIFSRLKTIARRELERGAKEMRLRVPGKVERVKVEPRLLLPSMTLEDLVGE